MARAPKTLDIRVAELGDFPAVQRELTRIAERLSEAHRRARDDLRVAEAAIAALEATVANHETRILALEG